MAAHRKQPMLHAQPPRRDVQQGDVAAVAVDDHELLHPGSRHCEQSNATRLPVSLRLP